MSIISASDGMILVQRLRRCPNIVPSLGECQLFAGYHDILSACAPPPPHPTRSWVSD